MDKRSCTPCSRGTGPCECGNSGPEALRLWRLWRSYRCDRGASPSLLPRGRKSGTREGRSRSGRTRRATLSTAGDSRRRRTDSWIGFQSAWISLGTPPPSILRKVFGELGLSLDFGLVVVSSCLLWSDSRAGFVKWAGLDSCEQAAGVEGAAGIEL